MKGEAFDEEELRRAIEGQGLDLIYRHSTESTNGDVLRHYASHGRAAVAVCERQTAGRGRRGRRWHSPASGNIYCTLGLFKEVPAERQAMLSIATGLALCRALRRGCGAEAALKWPNDLLAGGRKLGGILIESRLHAAGGFFFAIGFGINLSLAQSDLESIGRPAASLDAAAARPFERAGLLLALIDEVRESVRLFDPAQAAELASEFAAYDAFHEREVAVLAGGERIRGINRGIADDGQLRLETAQGVQLFSAAEISLEPHDACC
jgi:BirA family biotin operon repressor/biotin-[acetyl-CoA-carboxylase] ligase